MRPTAEDISRARLVFADHSGGLRCTACPAPEPAARRCPRWVWARETLTLAGLAQ